MIATQDIFLIRGTATASPNSIWIAPENAPRPTPHTTLSAITLHLAQTLLENIPLEDLAHTGIILGTTTGCLQADWEFDRSRRDANARYASPAAFARTLPSTLAAELSLKLNLKGPLLTLSAGNASTTTVLRRAYSWMKHLHLPHCLAGGFDTGPNPEEKPQAAFFLLSRTPSTLPQPPLQDPSPFNLQSPTDTSLHHLQTWITTLSRPPS